MMSDRYRDLKRLRQIGSQCILEDKLRERRARSTTRIRQAEVLRPADNNVMKRPASADRVSRRRIGNQIEGYKLDAKRINRENALIQVWAPRSKEKPRYKPGEEGEKWDRGV